MYKDVPILLDVDSVLSDFEGKILSYVNNRFGKSWTRQDTATKDMRSFFREFNCWDDLAEDFVKSAGFAQQMEILPGAQQFYQDLKSLDQPIVFVTSPYKNSPTWMYDRQKWLEKHFEATRNNVIFTKCKQYVGGVTLIDDNVDNVIYWSTYNSQHAILFENLWNKKKSTEAGHVERFDNYDAIVDYLRKELMLMDVGW